MLKRPCLNDLHYDLAVRPHRGKRTMFIERNVIYRLFGRLGRVQCSRPIMNSAEIDGRESYLAKIKQRKTKDYLSNILS